jgi:threonine/homoserine/homoserine lactone efflux protein
VRRRLLIIAFLVVATTPSPLFANAPAWSPERDAEALAATQVGFLIYALVVLALAALGFRGLRRVARATRSERDNVADGVDESES